MQICEETICAVEKGREESVSQLADPYLSGACPVMVAVLLTFVFHQAFVHKYFYTNRLVFYCKSVTTDLIERPRQIFIVKGHSYFNLLVCVLKL